MNKESQNIARKTLHAPLPSVLLELNIHKQNQQTTKLDVQTNSTNNQTQHTNKLIKQPISTHKLARTSSVFLVLGFVVIYNTTGLHTCVILSSRLNG